VWVAAEHTRRRLRGMASPAGFHGTQICRMGSRHARIGVMQALNRNVERVFTDRKDHHWGKRKLARDQ
jgi:hypothetical protein